jgi:hypothetical protein
MSMYDSPILRFDAYRTWNAETGHVVVSAPIENAQVPVLTAPVESLTPIVQEPVAVGVPVIAPVDVFNVKPGGSVPVATKKVYGGVPPVTIGAGLLKGTPTMPVLVVEHVSCRLGGVMVNGHVPEPTTPSASVTWIVQEPVAVGVPLIAPVAVFNVKPGGKVPVASEKV